MAYSYSAYSGLRVPDEFAGDDVPADLSFLVSQLDTALTLYAISVGDRDARFYNAPQGTICVVRMSSSPFTVSGVYVKTGAVGEATWGTIWQPPSDFTFVALGLQDAYVTRGSPTYDPGVWGEPGGIFAQCKGSIVRQDGGNITNGSTVAYLPGAFLPLYASSDYAIATAYVVGASGNNKISLANDGSMTYFGPPVPWIGFDSVRYFRAQS